MPQKSDKPDHAAVLKDLRRLAAEAKEPVDAPEGPDAELLRICAEVFQCRSQARTALNEQLYGRLRPGPERDAATGRQARAEAGARACMTQITRAPINSPAALYAKCAVLLGSYGAAPKPACSIAEAILTDGRLRRVLWPAEPV